LVKTEAPVCADMACTVVELLVAVVTEMTSTIAVTHIALADVLALGTVSTMQTGLLTAGGGR